MPTRLNALELDRTLTAAGFTNAEDRRIAWALAMRESSGYFDIVGGPNPNGTFDYGLFQINEIHKDNPKVNWSLILTAPENAKFAFLLTENGRVYAPWGLPNDDGSITGYAAVLKKNSPETWQLYYDRWKKWYDNYPSAIAAAKALETAGVVSLVNLKPWIRNADIREYQQALRKWLTPIIGLAKVNAINPAGATGYYGSQTIALTQEAYRQANKLFGLALPTNTTIPRSGLLKLLGLVVV